MQSADREDTTGQQQQEVDALQLDDQRREESERITAPIHQEGVARLLTVGVGGAGGNAVNRMIEANVRGIEFIAVNTDVQALAQSRAPKRVRIGDKLTRGLGTGGNPELGRKAAEESYAAIHDALAGADMVFITAGMGGGTGTGAAPLVAQAAREQGAVAVAVVTTPFAFERRRKGTAERGIVALREQVDALIVVPNERLTQLATHDMSVLEAYRMADDVLRQGIQGISDLITIPGLINLDFADVRTIMIDAGSALMSIGQASGENRAEEAAHKAITNPLLEVDVRGARGVVFNITGGDDLTLFEVNQIADIITGAAHPDANIIFGTTYDQSLTGSIKVTVVATAFEPRVTYDRNRLPWAIATPTLPQREEREETQPGLEPQPQPQPPAARPMDTRAPSQPRQPSAAPTGVPYVRVGSPAARRESFAVTPLDQGRAGREEGYGAARAQRTDEQIGPPRVAEPPGLAAGRGRRRADERHASVPLGYHGDQYIENEEQDMLDVPREAHHGLARLFNIRH